MQRESHVPGASYFYYPRLVVVVGARDEANDTTNFAPVTWASPLSSDPPLYGICVSPRTHTHELVLKTGEFTANFLSHEHASLVAGLGRVSGRDLDKAEAFSLELEPGEVLATPSLAAAYASVECILRDRHQLGRQTLLVGEVQVIQVRPDSFDTDGVLRVDRVQPLLYLGSNVFSTVAATSVVSPEPQEPLK